MATNNKANSNILINLFHKGMNTDTAVNMLDNEHYIYGKNVRITQQTPIGVAIDVNRTKGCITPVPKGESEKSTLRYYDLKEEDSDKRWKLLAASSVLAADSVDNYGAVIIKDTTGQWYVYRVEVNADGGLLYTFIFTAQDATTNKNRFSVVMSQELQDVIKLYVATEKGISQFDICDEKYNNALTSVDQTMSNKLWPYKKPIIDKKTEGALPVGQVQWVYRLYKNHGQFSKLSAVTNKIQVFSADRRAALGNEQASVDDEGKLSSSSSGIGFRLKIDLNYSDRAADAFDHVQLFRVQYYTQDVIKVFLISQVSYKKGQDSIAILDDGIEPLQEYTLEEFSALEGLDIVADSIETASQHMFAANIEDRSSIKLTLSDDVLSSHTVSSDKNRNCRLLNDEGSGNNTTYSQAEQAFVGGYFYNDGHKVEDSFEQSNYVYCPGEEIFGGKTPSDNDIQITWKFVEANIELHNNATHENPIPTVSSNSDTNLYYVGDNIAQVGKTASEYLEDQGINVIPQVYNYGDNITSSMFRSLRRGETYRYGIIYYNKYGQHTDVQWIDDIKVPSNFTSESTKATQDGDKVTIQACPIGIEFEVKIKDGIDDESSAKDITHYQIVRCAHTKEFSKQLYQVVQNAPIRCAYKSDLSGTSPWSPVATIQDFGFHTMIGYLKMGDVQSETSDKASYIRQWTATGTFFTNKDGQVVKYNPVNRYLKLIYGPDVNYLRNTVLSTLQQSQIKFRPIRRLYSQYGVGSTPSGVDGSLVDGIIAHPWLDLYYNKNRYTDYMRRNYKFEGEYFAGRKLTIASSEGIDVNCLPMLGGAASMTENDDEKNTHYVALNYYMNDHLPYSGYGQFTYDIESVSSVKQSNWEDNFTDVTTDWYEENDDGVSGVGDASEKYKNFTTTLVDALYNNWMCYDMYNMRPGFSGDTAGYIDSYYDWDGWWESTMFLPVGLSAKGIDTGALRSRGHAWSGPGPVALLAIFAQQDGKAFWGPWGTTKADYSEYGAESSQRSIYETPFITTLISLEHAGSTYQGTTKSELQYDTYYGFGNYGAIGEKLIVFDGDTYITPAEIQSAYKTWNKNASYTKGIRSMTVVNFVPIESEINSTLDYGQNFKNTFNPNVQVEPCDIEGVGVQERPQFQYNIVMSYNNYSAMSFTAQSEDKTDENYPQRIFYSEQKENGEAVDNWGLFKALNYVDANTKYGPITNLLTSKETLYFWQPSAFGKLSVNERSLITDENSNKIQLGTGGVLQRTDYIDTNTGMSKDQYAAIGVGDTVYWIDTLRKSVMKFQGGRVASVGVESATQNLLNWKFDDDDTPHISYDIQNDEVLCRCLKNGTQYICVNNLGIASSEYTRVYDDTITLHGVLYGLNVNMATIENVRYNYLKGNIEDMLSPMELKFAIAQDPNVTKVFDNQKIVVVKDNIELNDKFDEQFENMTRKYFTDIHEEQDFTSSNDIMSNREGEFEYALPRWNGDYGERMRGKWLVQDMISNVPKSDIAISQILTKVRTSFS